MATKPTYQVSIRTNSGEWYNTDDANLPITQALERAKHELKMGHTEVRIQIFNVRTLIMEAGGWDD